MGKIKAIAGLGKAFVESQKSKKSPPMADIFEGAVKKLNKRGGIRSFGKNFKKTKKYIVRGHPHGKKFTGEEIIKRVHRDQFKRDITATKIKASKNPEKYKSRMMPGGDAKHSGGTFSKKTIKEIRKNRKAKGITK